MKKNVSGVVVGCAIEGREYDKTLKLHQEHILNQRVLDRYALDEELINHGYRNGTAGTQHGVNAEHVYIASFNIKETRLAADEHRAPFYIEKSSAVNGPHDLVRGDEIYQVKYYKTAKGSLDACIKHLEKYPTDYQNNPVAYYIIPSDQYQTIMSIKEDVALPDISARSINALKKSIAIFEAKKGDSIDHSLLPGAVAYKDAYVENNQWGNENRHEEIDKTHKEVDSAISDAHQPSLVEAMWVSLFAGIVSGSLVLIYTLYKQRDCERSFWKLGKSFFSTLLISGALAGIIYSLSSIFQINAILIGSFIVALKEATIMYFKSNNTDQTSFERWAPLLDLTSEIFSLGLAVFGVFIIVHQITIKFIVSGSAIHYFFVIAFTMIASLLVRLALTRLIRHRKDISDKQIEDLIINCDKTCKRCILSNEYEISMAYERRAELQLLSRRISDRSIGTEKRLAAISEMNRRLAN